MFDEFPEAPLSSQIPSAAPRRRTGALGPKLILAVFVFALAFDLLSRIAGHFALRALRRLSSRGIAAQVRAEPRGIFPHTA